MGIFYRSYSTATAHHCIFQSEEALQFLPKFCVLFFFFFLYLICYRCGTLFLATWQILQIPVDYDLQSLRASLIQLQTSAYLISTPPDSLDADCTKLESRVMTHIWVIGGNRILGLYDVRVSNKKYRNSYQTDVYIPIRCDSSPLDYPFPSWRKGPNWAWKGWFSHMVFFHIFCLPPSHTTSGPSSASKHKLMLENLNMYFVLRCALRICSYARVYQRHVVATTCMHNLLCCTKRVKSSFRPRY